MGLGLGVKTLRDSKLSSFIASEMPSQLASTDDIDASPHAA